ncbi:hypothetical protein KUL42_38780 [Alteromonas sp. KUL42]|uniref:hypothetical protein n=1 Tax=Alteromonas sp. KUL42 TaxID=2480797 RepID=UPI001036DA2C|nr:hypothetical protein [Alteromonas sp. KUL42]TAP31685.1 hypothetical protein EYR97_19545 [Alteromonas sp. KUL42]GEA09117.1 hypothetical protein KUL42_38780 [Alteromonas sp. KUL42]
MHKMFIFVFSLVCVSACSSTAEHGNNFNSINYVNYSKGVKAIPAMVENPYPDCNEDIVVTRLDRLPTLQVKVDVENGGWVCKSTR